MSIYLQSYTKNKVTSAGRNELVRCFRIHCIRQFKRRHVEKYSFTKEV